MEAIKEIIDRGPEFDQAREHDHRDSRCWCSTDLINAEPAKIAEPAADCLPPLPTDTPHVSPAVWEYRAKQAECAAKKEAEENAILRQNVATLKSVLKDRDDAIDRLHARIAGFERMTAALAAGVDKAEQMFADLFGMRPEKFVAEHGGKQDAA